MASINCSVIFIISCLRAENRETEMKRGKEGEDNHKRLKIKLNIHIPLLMLSLNLLETSDIWNKFITWATPLVMSDIWSHPVQNTPHCPLSTLHTASNTLDAVFKSPCATETWSIFNKQPFNGLTQKTNNGKHFFSHFLRALGHFFYSEPRFKDE